MAKVGDKKDCRTCGTQQSAVYTRTTSNAAFVGPGGAIPERGRVTKLGVGSTITALSADPTVLKRPFYNAFGLGHLGGYRPG
jgi:hypothetical protein